jgi:hypothetical protein
MVVMFWIKLTIQIYLPQLFGCASDPGQIGLEISLSDVHTSNLSRTTKKRLSLSEAIRLALSETEFHHKIHHQDITRGALVLPLSSYRI